MKMLVYLTQFEAGFAGRDILDPEQNFWRQQEKQTNLGRLGLWLNPQRFSWPMDYLVFKMSIWL